MFQTIDHTMATVQELVDITRKVTDDKLNLTIEYAAVEKRWYASVESYDTGNMREVSAPTLKTCSKRLLWNAHKLVMDIYPECYEHILKRMMGE